MIGGWLCRLLFTVMMAWGHLIHSTSVSAARFKSTINPWTCGWGWHRTGSLWSLASSVKCKEGIQVHAHEKMNAWSLDDKLLKQIQTWHDTCRSVEQRLTNWKQLEQIFHIRIFHHSGANVLFICLYSHFLFLLTHTNLSKPIWRCTEVYVAISLGTAGITIPQINNPENKNNSCSNRMCICGYEQETESIWSEC